MANSGELRRSAALVPFLGTPGAFWAAFAAIVPAFGTRGALWQVSSIFERLSADSRWASRGFGRCSGQGGGGTPFARHPASLRGPVEHPTNRDLRGPRSAHSGPSQRLRRHSASEASFLRQTTCSRRAPPPSRARGWARPPLPLPLRTRPSPAAAIAVSLDRLPGWSGCSVSPCQKTRFLGGRGKACG